MKSRIGGNRGMTLIELLVVMSIIGLLAAMLGLVVPAVGKRMNEARTRSVIHKLISTLQFYNDDCGMYPDAINHNPGRNIEPVPAQEGGGGYPLTSKPTASRQLYQPYYDEQTKTTGSYSELVWTLGYTVKGWGRPQLFEKGGFKRSDLNGTGQIVDGYGRRLFYLPARAYRIGSVVYQAAPTPAEIKTVGGGAVMLLKGNKKGPFQCPGGYQIYSVGDNLKTGLDADNKGGTEVDDITNWQSLTE